MRADQRASEPIVLLAEVVVWSGLLLRCMIEGRQVDIPPNCVQPGTTVRRSGDQGILVVPSWCAAALGLA